MVFASLLGGFKLIIHFSIADYNFATKICKTITLAISLFGYIWRRGSRPSIILIGVIVLIQMFDY